MDRRNGKDEDETELQVAEKQRDMRNCVTWGSTKHLRPTCPLRRQRQTPLSRNLDPSQQYGMEQGNAGTQKARGSLLM